MSEELKKKLKLILESYNTAMHLGHIVLASKNEEALYQTVEQSLIDARVKENEYWYKIISKRKLTSTDFYNHIEELKQLKEKE